MPTELAVHKEVYPDHPMSGMLREDRFPHIWCPGCGLGTTLSSFVAGIQQAKVDLDKTCVVSGIGCAGRVADARRDQAASPHISPFSVASGSRRRCGGAHAAEGGEGVADTTSSRPQRVRTVTASVSGRAAGNR